MVFHIQSLNVPKLSTNKHIIVIFLVSSSWWSLGLEDDIICASYLWVREWLCRPILDLQSRAQSGHWNFAFVAGIEAAKWRRSLADCLVTTLFLQRRWRRLCKCAPALSVQSSSNQFSWWDATPLQACFHCVLEMFAGAALSPVILL